MNRSKVIDFHAHILPGADHGCRNPEENRQQLMLAREANVDLVIATPHFYPHKESLEHFFEKREKACMQMGKEERSMIRAGAEVFVCHGMERLPQIEKLCIEDTDLLLLEMPDGSWNTELFDTVLEIQNTLGLRVVLAHVDRYDKRGIQELFDQGICGQINAEALSSLFVKRHLKDWIRNGNIVALGSDIHGVKNGYRDFSKVRKLHGEWFEVLMERTRKLYRW